MPYPTEYELAGRTFAEFLSDVKANAEFGSSHMAYTMAQGVFQVFRRRVSLQDAIRFANLLPAGLRALFVADWDPDEEPKRFEDREAMTREVRLLRPDHNFSTDRAISDVAKALRRRVDERRFDQLLQRISPAARAFWYRDD